MPMSLGMQDYGDQYGDLLCAGAASKKESKSKSAGKSSGRGGFIARGARGARGGRGAMSRGRGGARDGG